MEAFVVDEAQSIEEKPIVVKVTDRGRTGVVMTGQEGEDGEGFGGFLDQLR